MFTSGAKASVNLPRTEYYPLEQIAGHVGVVNKSSLTVRSIEVVVEGWANTRAKQAPYREGKYQRTDGSSTYDDSSSIESENVRFYKDSVVVFPPAGISGQKSFTLQQGQHGFDFSVVLPDKCVGTDNPSWRFIDLPPSVSLPFDFGSINYQVSVVVHRPGFLAKSIRKSTQIRILPTASVPEGRRLAFAKRDLVVSVYAQPSGFFSMIKQALGFGVTVAEQRLSAQVQLPLSGLPASLPGHLTNLQDSVKLLITRVGEQPKYNEKPVQCVVTSLEVSLVGTYSVQAKRTAQSHDFKHNIKSLEPHTMLEFDPETSQADISDLLGELSLPEGVVSLLLPTMQSTYKLRIDIGISPNCGDPITPTFAKLLVDIPIYGHRAAPPSFDAAVGTSHPKPVQYLNEKVQYSN